MNLTYLFCVPSSSENLVMSQSFTSRMNWGTRLDAWWHHQFWTIDMLQMLVNAIDFCITLLTFPWGEMTCSDFPPLCQRTAIKIRWNNAFQRHSWGQMVPLSGESTSKVIKHWQWGRLQDDVMSHRSVRARPWSDPHGLTFTASVWVALLCLIY